MKRSASILFAIILLLSSGLVQFVVHVCPENGAVFSAESCHSHTPSHKKDCCLKIMETAADVCCNDQFVFAVSAKFGGIIALELNQPAYTVIAKSEFDLHSHVPSFSKNSEFRKHYSPPGNLGRWVLQCGQKLTI